MRIFLLLAMGRGRWMVQEHYANEKSIKYMWV
jgi:hypothetical protein